MAFLRTTDAETLTETGNAAFQQRDRGLLHTDIERSRVFKMDLGRNDEEMISVG